MKGGPHNRFQVTMLRLVPRPRRTKVGLRRDDDRGFTMVEVLIVLAVTGALFVSAVVLISGRQNKTEFATAINEIKTQIQQTVSDVQTGFYPTNNNLSCQVNGTGQLDFVTGSATQGSSKDCIFLGKVLQFGLSGTDPQQFMAYSVAGKRQANDKDVQNYAEAAPKVMTADASSPVDTPTIVDTLQYGLTVVPDSMVYTVGGVSTKIGAVGFLSTLNTFDTDKSGAQQVQLVPVQGTALGTTAAAGVSAVNANLATSPVAPDGGVSICFASGGTDQSGLIKIGGNGRELSVTLSIKGNKTCS